MNWFEFYEIPISTKVGCGFWGSQETMAGEEEESRRAKPSERVWERGVPALG